MSEFNEDLINNVDETESDSENAHWWNVLRSFLTYSSFSLEELQIKQERIENLPEELKQKLSNKPFKKFELIKEGINLNQEFFDDIVHFHSQFCTPPKFAIDHYNSLDEEKRKSTHIFPSIQIGSPVPYSSQHRNIAVLHSCFREWSIGGEVERRDCFSKLISLLVKYVPINHSHPLPPKVLVPGCGLGRLPLEIASQGYICEGNEFSAFMASASNFILNALTQASSYLICPWVNNSCNIKGISDLTEAFSIPDIAGIDFIKDLPPLDNDVQRFTMSTGDFEQIYGSKKHKGGWNSIVTCYFIDTAPVILKYISIIHHLLEDGGYWINQGPLLYHWVSNSENSQDERYSQSIELSYEEIKDVIVNFGFEFVHEEWVQANYARSSNTMMWTTYDTVVFVVRKVSKN